jgi:PPOX class probable F420-dependent enzyme
MASDASAPSAPLGGESALARLGSGKYLLVTTHRKDGRTVPTPVWVVREGDALVTTTVADSGKVKRIRNRADVLVAPCDIRGNRTGEDVLARAELVDAQLTEHYQDLIRRKYGLVGRLISLGSRLRRGRQGTVGLRITLVAAE